MKYCFRCKKGHCLESNMGGGVWPKYLLIMYFLYFNTCTAENALLCEVTKQISDMTQNELLDMYHFAIHIKSKRLLLPMET